MVSKENTAFGEGNTAFIGYVPCAWRDSSFRMVRAALVTSIVACALLAPGAADAAGAVLPSNAKPDPSFVDMRIAVAITPTGSTRWSEITVPAATPVMWLVPVRPGAAIDWAPRRWLDALDDATAVRVLPPSSPSACPSRSTPETTPPWTTPGPTQPAAALAVHATAESARAYVTERGYRLSPLLTSRISDLYTRGWNLVAVEMASSSSSSVLSTRTLRVSDDGGAILPLALTGSSSTRVTVFAIGEGVAAVPGAREIDTAALRWGTDGSTFAEWRRALVAGGETWLRESSSHFAIFEGTPVAGESPLASVVAGYFDGTSCTSSAARDLSARETSLDTTCAPGAAARVPGGGACVPSSGGLDPAALSCNRDIDLALALSGLVPAKAVVTRLVGSIPADTFGRDLLVDLDAGAKQKPPVIRAGASDECPGDDSPSPPLRPRPSASSSSSGSGGEEAYVPASDGCGGSAVATSTTYEEEAVDESSESCSGDGSPSWDDSDDSDDSSSGDSCSSDDSSSSDGCSRRSSSSSSGGDSDGWDTDDDDDGWDTDDDMSPRGKELRPTSKTPKKPKPHAKATKKKSSPVSRYALLAVALLLPLRRRQRDSERQ